MPRSILILSNPTDWHAFAVVEALERKGARPTLWHTSDFPSRATESVSFTGASATVAIHGPDLCLDPPRVDTIWRRRPAIVVDKDALHPADRPFAEVECRTFRQGLLDLLGPDAFWVNAPDAAARASRKMLQHRLAVDVGLVLPDTLYSNDPERIRTFLLAQGGRLVYKPLRGLSWRDDHAHFLPYTNLIASEDLVEDAVLRHTPGIFQALVPKAFELRVTFIGTRAFAAKIHSQDTQTGRLDWRKSGEDELRMEEVELPGVLLERCIRLMDHLGIVFGCFDFIVTPENDVIFLEVNEMGQFLFVEDYAELPLLDAFSELLLQGRRDFAWPGTVPPIRFADVKDLVAARLEHASQNHVAPSDDAVYEAAATPASAAPSA